MTVIFFVVCLNKKDKQFNIERQDYINRIVSKSTKEYIELKKSDVSVPKVLTDAEILGDDRFNGILN